MSPSRPPRREAAPLRPLHPLAVAALLAAALWTTACGGNEPPVGSLSADPSTVELGYPQATEVRLTWSMDAPLDTSAGRPLVFVHLLGADGEVLRTFDHPFPEPWHAGDEVTYPLEIYQSMLGPPLPAGSYQLTAGLYEGDRRWPLEAGEEMGRDEYRVATVQALEAAPSTLPGLEYQGAWGPLSSGQDRQNLGWRALRGNGRLEISGAPEDGVLGVHFEIDPLSGDYDRVRKAPAGRRAGAGAMAAAADDDAASAEGDGTAAPAVDPSAPWQPTLRVVSDCDGSETMLSGVGAGAVRVAVEAGQECVMRVRPDFTVEPGPGAPKGAEVPSVARVARPTWTPAG